MTARPNHPRRSTCKLGTPEASDRVASWLAFTGGMLAFVVYVLTMAPTAFGLDSAELATAAFTLGIPHSPGYSAYTLVAHAFTWLPWGDVAFRVNLLSGVAGAGMVALLIYHLQAVWDDGWTALAAGLGLAFTYYAWSVSVVAEVYTFQVLLLVAMVALLWHRRRTGRRWPLIASGACAGIAFANNPSTALWWPGLVVLVSASGEGSDDVMRTGAGAAAAMAAGALFVLYLPLRYAAGTEFIYAGTYDIDGSLVPPDLTQLPGLAYYLSGRQFADLFPQLDWSLLAAGGAQVVRAFWGGWLGFGVVLGGLGLYLLWRDDRSWALGLFTIFMLHTSFFAAYRAVDTIFMLLPSFMIWAIFIAAGLRPALRSVAGRLRPLALLLPAALLIVNWSFVDLSDSRGIADTARSRLHAAEAGSLYFAAWGDAAVMHYWQHVHDVGREVNVVNTFFLPDGGLAPMIRSALQQGRAVYSSQRELVPSGFSTVGSDPTYRVTSPEGGDDGAR